MNTLPPWFRVLVWGELILQLPFFFLASFAYATGKQWIQKPAIVYGLCVGSTTVPMLAEFALSPRTDFKRGSLLMFYVPYLVIPLLMAFRMLASDRAFPVKRKQA